LFDSTIALWYWQGMNTKTPPISEIPPLCSCGCGNPVTWRPYCGWYMTLVGHSQKGRPGSRLGYTTSEETKKKQSEAAKRRFVGKRKRDIENKGPAVYSTHEYREAKKRLVEGQPCLKCGSFEHVHAHHQIPGNDDSLIPLCRACHASHHHATVYTKRNQPPAGSTPPLCGCGCGRPVKWKRVRGWAKFCKGHGFAKVPAGTCNQEAPSCACGCGEPTKYRFGKGWNKFKQGHSQRIEGHYTVKRKTNPPVCSTVPVCQSSKNNPVPLAFP